MWKNSSLRISALYRDYKLQCRASAPASKRGYNLPRELRLATAMVLVAGLAAAHAQSDQRQDFLAGRTLACPRCELAGMNFKRRDLSGADLSGANLAQANFHDAKLAGADLAGADLSGANL